ncbi:HpcH/HpaI aldolase/citrate lyase family protein [Altererythrobacter sp. GH1-8]|uniref:HpcH/HpaI aldolase/citrate lyase family protein n=1 Tax=Altererythrobacter sp. GH1-8 TaxID=3349333 RepID=UPI00374D54DA
MRSWLLVPAENEEQLEEASSSGADVVVLDLDQARSESARADGRERAADWMRNHREQVLQGQSFARWVRISPIESEHWREDLRAALAGAAEGIFLPAVPGPAYVQQLASEVYEVEQRCGIAHGATQIIPLIASRPQSVLSLSQFAENIQPRLGGFSWESAVLADAISARREHNSTGEWFGALAHTRAQIILLAKACGLLALESAQPATMPEDAFANLASAARADGFNGMFANSPAQVKAINAAFTPTESELARAQNVIAQFTSNPNAEHVRMGNRVLNRADLLRARQMLEAVNMGVG